MIIKRVYKRNNEYKEFDKKNFILLMKSFIIVKKNYTHTIHVKILSYSDLRY